ncbi:MAG: CZB domain-containing protein [Alphaproteobacteria bacterium]|nr:CZB domain-containing protein [Alphaproteobacteria bacterium]
MFDISRARLVHLKWLMQLEEALRHGKSPALASHTSCELGQWLYDEGLAKYKKYPEISFLEKRHQRFHETTELLVRLFQDRNFVEAEVALDELKRESQDLIFMLTMLEYRITGGPDRVKS